MCFFKEPEKGNSMELLRGTPFPVHKYLDYDKNDNIATSFDRVREFLDDVQKRINDIDRELETLNYRSSVRQNQNVQIQQNSGCFISLLCVIESIFIACAQSRKIKELLRQRKILQYLYDVNIGQLRN